MLRYYVCFFVYYTLLVGSFFDFVACGFYLLLVFSVVLMMVCLLVFWCFDVVYIGLFVGA